MPSCDVEFDLKDELENYYEGHFRVKHPKVDPEMRFEGNLNSSLTSGSRCRK